MLRFAQSPTHDMNIGDLRIAILSYLVSQQRQENFTIRIDDTDTSEIPEGKDTEIMQILEKFALKHNTVFHQSEHLHMHQALAIKLLENGKAFVCTCNEDQEECSAHCAERKSSEYARLKKSAEPFVVRIKKPTQAVIFSDLVKGEVTTNSDEIGAFVILRQDASVTHDFASACDDMLSGVTYLIQEDKNISGTAKQKYIKTALGYKEETTYVHLPILHNNDTLSILSLFQQGFIPDAIINYLLLLSNPYTPEKIFTLPEAITWFKIEDIPRDAVNFDIDTLRSINREHLMRIEDKQLSSLFGFADTDVGKLVKLYLNEASTINELALRIRPVFAPKAIEGEWKEKMMLLQKIIMDAPMIEEYDAFITYLMEKSGLTDEKLFIPLRLLLTGAKHGPELSEIYPLIKSYLLEVIS